jgi:hypothetical protein
MTLVIPSHWVPDPYSEHGRDTHTPAARCLEMPDPAVEDVGFWPRRHDQMSVGNFRFGECAGLQSGVICLVSALSVSSEESSEQTLGQVKAAKEAL